MIDIPEHKSIPLAAGVVIRQRKRERPQGSKDKIPRKRKLLEIAETIPTQKNEFMTLSSPQLETPEKLNLVETKISFNFVHTGEVLDRKNILVDNQFAYHIVNSSLIES